MNNKRSEFKELTDREHCLARPGMYIGGVDLIEKEQWLYDRDAQRFRFGTAKFVPALMKCFSEILDNCIDVAIDTNFEAANRITIEVAEDHLTVQDNGIGIPCEFPKDCADRVPENSIPCKCWTKLKAGTSFGEDQDKIGTNGLGSSVVNVFSKRFIGQSDDGRQRQTIECTDNMLNVKASKFKPSSGRSGCKVTVYPDFSRFGVDRIDAVHMDLIYQRLINLSICYPKIRFQFNGERIKVNEKEFGRMFSDDCVIASSGNATIAVFPNEQDEFRFYSTVNGLSVGRGGTHVDYVASEICGRVRDRLVKKYKTIRPGDVKSKLAMIVFLTGFKNCKWDSQTKEMLQNSQGDITRHLAGGIDFDDFVRRIMKSAAIVDPIVETFRIKEELKARQELKNAKRVKVKSDKYFPGIGAKKYLFLVEGLSAGAGLMKCLGREGKYYYCLRGLPLNAYSSTIQKISANQEVKEVLNVLNLDISKPESCDDIDFEKIVIATDADLDGINISSMLFGWWKRLAPRLYENRKIYKLNTPVVIVKDAKDRILKWFFFLDEFRKWEKQNTDRNVKILYLKGLGSLSVDDLDYIIKNSKDGFDGLLDEFYLDSESDGMFEDWLGDDSEPRKKYLREYNFDINMI